MAILATAQNTYPKAVEVPGDMKAGTYEVTFSGASDYLTGGVSPIAAIKLASGFGNIVDIHLACIGPTLAAGIFAASWDAANQKVKLYTSLFAEVANAADISSIKMYFYVRGR
jgi:hypothetical protein